MTALVLGLVFVLSWVATRISLALGLIVVVCVGYLYGIYRANVLDYFSYLTFDAAVVAFYVASARHVLERVARGQASRTLLMWVGLLAAWSAILLARPGFDPLVQLLGLRGNLFLLPFLLVGASLTTKELRRLAFALALLNVIAFAVAIAETAIGVQRFFPLNSATELIYRSNDVTHARLLRIPSVFVNAHVYGNTMVATLPLLLGVLSTAQAGRAKKALLILGITCTAIGVFLCAARSPVIVLVVVLVAAMAARSTAKRLAGMVVLTALIAMVVWSTPRLQRFMTLQDTDFVSSRVHDSINISIMEVVFRYPLGNGLGSGGTSLPAFLEIPATEGGMRMENEYGRILWELGLPGLLLWLGLIVFLLRRPPIRPTDRWHVMRATGWALTAATFAMANLGIGLVTAIPTSLLLFVVMGWMATSEEATATVRSTDVRLLRPLWSAAPRNVSTVR